MLCHRRIIMRVYHVSDCACNCAGVVSVRDVGAFSCDEKTVFGGAQFLDQHFPMAGSLHVPDRIR